MLINIIYLLQQWSDSNEQYDNNSFGLGIDDAVWSSNFLIVYIKTYIFYRIIFISNK